MPVTASVLLAAALSLSAATDVRLLNPGEVAADAVLTCGGIPRRVTVAARDVADIDARGCTSLDALAPLAAFETALDDAGEWQRVIDTNAECGSAEMNVPLFACKNGAATAAVQPVDGATYTWTAEGATIVEGAGTHRVLVQLTDPKTAKLTCVIAANGCTTTASGAIAIREPLVVRQFVVPEGANANEPVTVAWSYERGAEPVSQMLAGSAFAQPVTLDGAQRSYTFTPTRSGTVELELRASYAKSAAPVVRKRRRAAGGGVIATACPSVRTSAKMEVRGCGAAEPRLTAPDDVGAGETFEVLLDVGDKQKVEWSVENGTLVWASPFGERAGFQAGAGGSMKIGARVERTPGCFASSEAVIAIVQPLNQCALPPSANLVITSHDCDSATVTATFTGTPPFKGEWSDGTPIHTERPIQSHVFRTAGAYTISRFRDASCFGRVEGATLERFTASSTIKAEGSCGTYKLTATFKGVPPFNGFWADGRPISTSETQIERTVTLDGEYPTTEWYARVSDASCNRYGPIHSGNTVTLDAKPLARYGPRSCQTGPANVWIGVWFDRGNRPFVAEWTDGTVATATQPYTSPQRSVSTNGAPTRDLELKRVTAAGCEADVDTKLLTLYYRPTPRLSSFSPQYMCAGGIAKAILMDPPGPGGTIEWEVSGGRVVNELTSSAMSFTSQYEGVVGVSASATYADNFCNSASPVYNFVFRPPGNVGNVRIEPASIPRFGTARLTFEASGTYAAYVSVPSNRSSNFRREGNGGTYTDTVGPGTVPITVEWTGCDPADVRTETVYLTITP